MRCSRCGVDIGGSECPKCGASRPLMAGFFLGFGESLPGIDVARVRHALRVFASRRWGAYHQLLAGKAWEEGERELWRTQLLGLSVFAVDHHVVVARAPLCILTDRRLVVCDPVRPTVEIRLEGIGRLAVIRDNDNASSACRVAIGRVGSPIHDPEGDIGLVCGSIAGGRELQSRIEAAIEQKVGTSAMRRRII